MLNIPLMRSAGVLPYGGVITSALHAEGAAAGRDGVFVYVDGRGTQ